MFTWIGLALQLLKLVNAIMSWAKESELIQRGYDQAIADQTKAILEKTVAGKRMLEKVNAMPIEDVDDALIGLDPK
jgi:hypothetical protein